MRITAIEVEGFGVLSGLSLRELSEELNVFFGPNEAGKTTLLEFLRATLYGYSEARRRYLPPLRGGRPGGSIEVHDGRQSLIVSRYCERPDAQGHDRAAVASADGTLHDETLLAALLSGLDEEVFANVFAVGLEEIQQLATLRDTDAAAALYELSLGHDRVSLIEVFREVQRSRAALIDRGGRSGEIAQLAAERARLAARLGELREGAEQYQRLAIRRRQSEEEAGRLQGEREQLAGEVRLIEAALTVAQRWREREALDERLQSFADLADLPAGAVERLEAVEAQLQKCRRQAARVKRLGAALRRRVAALKINDALERQAGRIEALREQGPWLAALRQQIAELEAENASAGRLLDTEYQQLGIAGDVGSAGSAGLTERALTALRRPAQAIARGTRQLDEARQRQRRAETQRERIAAELEDALESRGEADLAEAIDRVSGEIAQLRRHQQLDERIERLERHYGELQLQSRGLLDQQMLPAGKLFAVGLLVVSGVAMLLTGLFHPAVAGNLAWIMAGGGAVVAVGGAGSKLIMERANRRRLAGCRQQMAMLEAQIEQARRQREALHRESPTGDEPPETRLAAAEEELAALQRLLPLEDERRSAEEELAEAAEGVADIEAQVESARRQWREGLAAAGLPRDVTPKQVRALLDRWDHLADHRRRQNRNQEELEQRRRELEGLTQRIAHLVDDVGLSGAGEAPADQLAALVAALEGQQSRLGERHALRQKMRRLAIRLKRLGRSLRRLRRRRLALLRRAGAKSGSELRRRAAELARRDTLRRQRQGIDAEIAAALGTNYREEDVAALLAEQRPEQLARRRDAARDRLAAVETQLAAAFESRGQLQHELRQLAEDRRPAELHLEQATAETRLEAAIFRWQTLSVVARLLEGIRAGYERDRQPETLREASGYLAQFTQGRYQRVWTPLGREGLLVDDDRRQAVPVDLLSRGAREQLLICLRMALVDWYARRGVDLPMVLDDVLVNFDADRARAAAAALRDFAAAGRQVFVFTCHEHIAELFADLGVAVQALPDHAGRLRSFAPRREAAPAVPAPPPEPVEEQRSEPAHPPPTDERSTRTRRKRTGRRRAQPSGRQPPEPRKEEPTREAVPAPAPPDEDMTEVEPLRKRALEEPPREETPQAQPVESEPPPPPVIRRRPARRRYPYDEAEVELIEDEG